jgi:hypothetical protein
VALHVAGKLRFSSRDHVEAHDAIVESQSPCAHAKDTKWERGGGRQSDSRVATELINNVA